MNRRIHFIVNPISGRRRNRRRQMDLFVARLTERGHVVDVWDTAAAGDATRLAAEAVAAGADLICVAGGDGTIHEAVAGMVDSGIPILPIPCGTENVVAKYLGIRLEATRLWAAFEANVIRRFGIMQANGRNVLFSCGLGLDGQIIRDVSARRAGHISYWTYVIPFFKAFFTYRSADLDVTVDNKSVYRGPAFVLIGKVPRYAMGLKALWQADPADDWVDVAVFPRRRMLPLMWDALRIWIRPGWRSAKAVYAKGKVVRVSAESPTSMQMDGEYTGDSSLLEVGLSHAWVNFVASPNSHGSS